MEKSNWLNRQASLYKSHSDNTGRPASYHEILLCSFGSNMNEISALRQLDINDAEYKKKAGLLKSKLQCFTPAALLKSKASGKVEEIERTGIMQLDFDFKDIKDFDIDELKQAVFSLPFIAFCGLSCSGNGFYALGLIAEPEKLNEYAEHCFEILKTYEIIPDESKGKKVENLRYISYDANMLIREDPEPLKIKNFIRKAQPETKNQFLHHSFIQTEKNDKRIGKLLDAIAQAQPGQRMSTISKYSFTLGGLGKPELLDSIKGLIVNSSCFSDQESDFLKCAQKCFSAGSLKPIH